MSESRNLSDVILPALAIKRRDNMDVRFSSHSSQDERGARDDASDGDGDGHPYWHTADAGSKPGLERSVAGVRAFQRSCRQRGR